MKNPSPICFAFMLLLSACGVGKDSGSEQSIIPEELETLYTDRKLPDTLAGSVPPATPPTTDVEAPPAEQPPADPQPEPEDGVEEDPESSEDNGDAQDSSASAAGVVSQVVPLQSLSNTVDGRCTPNNIDSLVCRAAVHRFCAQSGRGTGILVEANLNAGMYSAVNIHCFGANALVRRTVFAELSFRVSQACDLTNFNTNTACQSAASRACLDRGLGPGINMVEADLRNGLSGFGFFQCVPGASSAVIAFSLVTATVNNVCNGSNLATLPCLSAAKRFCVANGFQTGFMTEFAVPAGATQGEVVVNCL